MKTFFKLFMVVIFIATGCEKLAAQESWTAPKSTDDLKNPFKGDASATVEGKTMFNQMCAICHGRNGDGKGGGGVSLDPKPADLLAVNVKNETDGAIFWKMTEGKPPMASYKDMLSEDQRWKLVNYIRELENN